MECCRDGQREFECVEHELLHAKDLVAVVRLVADVNKVADLRCIDLFTCAASERASEHASE